MSDLAHLAADVGTVHGCAAICWPSSCARPPFVAVSRAWNSADEVAAVRDWLRRVIPSLPCPLAPQWTVERPFVTRDRPQAGAAQYDALRVWERVSCEFGAELVDLPSSAWRAPFGIPNGNAEKASRAWQAFLWPGIPLGARDHTSDSLRGALVAAGGAPWATAQLAAGVAAGDPLALAVVRECSVRRRKGKGGASRATTARATYRGTALPLDVEAMLRRRADAGDVRAQQLLGMGG